MINGLCESCGGSVSSGMDQCRFCGTPYSATVLQASREKQQIDSLKMMFREGRVSELCLQLQTLFEQQAIWDQCAEIQLLYAKTLLELESETSRVEEALRKASVAAPGNEEIEVYKKLLSHRRGLCGSEARAALTKLESLHRAHPENAHVAFTLGAYLYWQVSNYAAAKRALESAVRSRPAFLRAWACLASLHRTRGEMAPAREALKKCLNLETNPKQREEFRRMMNSNRKSA